MRTKAFQSLGIKVGYLNRILTAGILTTSVAGSAFGASYIVKVKENRGNFQAFASQKSLAGGSIVDQHENGNIVLVNFDHKSIADEAATLASLYANPDVEYVVENRKVHALAMPNDPDTSKQWSLAKVKASEAWSKGVGSRSVVVAVIDTGVDYKHPDIAANIWTNSKEIAGNGVDDDKNGYVDDVNGFDFNKNDADPMDEVGTQNPGHGTHCAGIMGAVGNNGTGISGMSQQLSIMPVRFLGADGSGDLMGAVKSIDYATNNGARVISASWGGPMSASQVQPITEAISRANDKGVMFIAAAANDGKNNDVTEMYPANTPLPNVITVAASTTTDTKASFSNFGLAKVHVAAPGVDIWSTIPSNQYRNLSGTSMATPLVSGLVGLMLSHDSTLTGPQTKALLQASGTKVAIETACECRVDAESVVNRVLDRGLTLVPQAITINPNQTQQFSAFGGSGGYKFASSADSIATIDDNGLLTAKATGELEVTVTDSKGANNTSLRLRVVEAGSGGGGGGGGGGTPTECPLDPQMCEAICQIMPTLPWCN
ncbi:MAG: S8 family serine peptidase [Proteobacteria bacterium]|nr:S8 family serine peptidase [Pseudomonadota bacterium]